MDTPDGKLSLILPSELDPRTVKLIEVMDTGKRIVSATALCYKDCPLAIYWEVEHYFILHLPSGRFVSFMCHHTLDESCYALNTLLCLGSWVDPDKLGLKRADLLSLGLVTDSCPAFLAFAEDLPLPDKECLKGTKRALH